MMTGLAGVVGINVTGSGVLLGLGTLFPILILSFGLDVTRLNLPDDRLRSSVRASRPTDVLNSFLILAARMQISSGPPPGL